MRNKLVSKFRAIVLVVVLVLIALVCCFLFPCCFSNNEIRNVILISIDTCRADHLSCYGYSDQIITPNIDRLAKESIVFSNAYSPVPLTLPAHCSMLTGKIPPNHGIHDNLGYKLDKSNITLAEIMLQNNYTTGAIISAFVLDSQFGLNQGFEYYNDRIENTDESLSSNVQRKGEETNRFAFEWLEQHKKDRFFLFLHYYDPHFRYDPPEPFASKFSDNPYVGEIAYTDYCIGQVVEKLKQHKLYDSALIIVTADHGEMLGEHREDTHGYFIYQSSIKIPLIFKLPGYSKRKKIDIPASIIDIVPTICTVIGVPTETPSNIQGKDLSPFFDNNRLPSQDRCLYCESLYPTKFGANSLVGVVNDSWKYIQTTRPELYNLIEDPDEANNLMKHKPHRARLLQDRLSQILENSARAGNTDNEAVLDEKTRNRLESLGYLASTSVDERFEFLQDEEDPKDLIGFANLNYSVHMLASNEEFEEAIKVCEKMTETRPQARDIIAEAYFKLGTAMLRKKKIEDGLSYLRKTLQINPDHEKAHTNIAYALMLQGKDNEAIKHCLEAIRLNPEKDINAYYNLACIYARRNNLNESVKWLKKAIDKGFKDWNTLKIDKDLESIRNTAYFIEILNDSYSTTNLKKHKD